MVIILILILIILILIHIIIITIIMIKIIIMIIIKQLYYNYNIKIANYYIESISINQLLYLKITQSNPSNNNHYLNKHKLTA